MYLDFSWQVGRKKKAFITPYELFVEGGVPDYLKPEVERAIYATSMGSPPTSEDVVVAIRDAAEAKELRDQLEEQKKAREQRLREEAKETKRILAVRKDANLQWKEFDPLSTARALIPDTFGASKIDRDAAFGSMLASPKQKEYLIGMGMPEKVADRLLKAEASKLITTLKYRRIYGFATYRQVSELCRLGMDAKKARGMKFKAAQATIDQLRRENLNEAR